MGETRALKALKSILPLLSASRATSFAQPSQPFTSGSQSLIRPPQSFTSGSQSLTLPHSIVNANGVHILETPGFVKLPGSQLLLPETFQRPPTEIIKGAFTRKNLSDAFNNQRQKIKDEYNRVFQSNLSLGEEIINFTLVGPIKRFARFQGMLLNNSFLLFIICNIASQIGISTCDSEKLKNITQILGDEVKKLIVTTVRKSGRIDVNIDCLDCPLE